MRCLKPDTRLASSPSWPFRGHPVKLQLVADQLEPQLLRNTLYWGHGAGNEQKVFSSYLPTLQQVYDNDVARAREMTVVVGPGFSGLEGLTG